MTFKNQYTADGAIVSFEFTFSVPVTRTLNVYVQIGEKANEVDDLLPASNYTIMFSDPTAGLSAGDVIFSTAPAKGKIITIRPSNDTDISTEYSNTTQFDATELNTSFNESSATNANSQSLYLTDALRYNENEDEDILSQYKNTIEPLEDKAFWRRESNEIISQDYLEFVKEIAKDLNADIQKQVGAAADNVNLSADITSNAFGAPYSGDVKTIDDVGNVVSTPITPGQSALSGAKSAALWAVSDPEFTDAFGTMGFSAKHYSEQAQTAASNAGGVITELYVEEANAITQVNLIDYTETPNEPWVSVLENSFTVYVNGLKLSEPTSYSDGSVVPDHLYSVTIKPNPTLAEPSFITFDPAIAANSKILIARSIAQGNSATMFVDSTNATFVASSKVAARDLSNVTFSPEYCIAHLTAMQLPVGAINTSPIYNNIGDIRWVKTHGSEGALLIISGSSNDNILPVDDGSVRGATQAPNKIIETDMPLHSHKIANPGDGSTNPDENPITGANFLMRSRSATGGGSQGYFLAGNDTKPTLSNTSDYGAESVESQTNIGLTNTKMVGVTLWTRTA